MGRAGIASNTASQQRASLRMGLTPSGRENDSMSITGSPLDGLNKDRFDVPFPPLPDQTELLGLFTALDENVLVSLEGFILEKISAVESEIVSHGEE
ncbi:MAG: hypothetical protein BJ554DRAFT_4356 [Olpidium bornovanus]|uniref:Uncharacterized protein n=1 Tax=Olpidium bornovanus TaxID=278681 RepID=A0A8H7ZZZ8_9FUNG|nr:MAG: hypothetical protein BJ554DRAFT_4356 [Olpidium bornovanus]